MNRRRRPTKSWRWLLFIAGVGLFFYLNQIVLPHTNPLFIPTPTPTRSPDSYVNDAKDLTAQGKLSQAISAYKEAIRVDPKNPANYIEMSRLQLFTGDYKNAQVNAENALMLNQGNPTAGALRAWALSFQGDFLTADSAVQAALTQDPNSALAHAVRAFLIALEIDANKGDLNSVNVAGDESRKALELGPNLMEAYWARGFVLEVTGNNPEAIQTLDRAIQLNGNIAELHLALGRNYTAIAENDNSMFAKAVEEFTRASSLDPTNPDPDTYIASIYTRLGEFPKAIQYAEYAVKNAPTDPYRYGALGRIQYRSQDYEAAVESLRLAVRGGATKDGVRVDGLPLDYGKVAEFYYSYGLALAHAGQCQEAVEISQVLVQTVKNDEIAMYNADAMVSMCQGNPTPAAGETLQPKATATPKK